MNPLVQFYVIAGISLALLGLPLLFGLVGPNPIYGFRLPQTFKDKALWYAVNRYGARWLIAAGLATVGGAVLFSYIPGITVDGYALAVLGVLALVSLTGMVQTVRFMRAEMRKKQG